MTATDNLRRLLDEFERDLCHAGCGVKCETYAERKELLDGVKDRYAQAIADELNATLNTRAERTCECVAEYAKSPIDGKTIVLHRCSACRELMRPHMAYCPNCGFKIRKAVKR